jgi:hypothetical protein
VIDMLVQVSIELPEEVIRDARELGILEVVSLTQLLQAEIDRRVNDLVNEEIHTWRAEERAQQALNTAVALLPLMSVNPSMPE